jgi:3-keto-5-aminohexanoate cleavage enzyme
MAEGVWLEVALNGPWTRQRQPGIPVTRAEIVEQAVACADAGAAIVHLHAYDEGSGRPREAYDLYAPVFEAIRSRRDVICYPTVPMGARPSQGPAEARARYEVVEGLGRAGLIEWAVVDPGSVTLATFAELRDGEDGFLYANSASDVRIGLELCGQHGLVPSYAIYEPGFLRTGAALRAAVPGSPSPVYRFMFSTAFTFGLPPTEWALDSYLRLLDASDPGAPWMIAGLGVELDGLWDAAMARGGHLRVGLEDAPPGCTRTNAEMVAEACHAVQQAGRPLATAAEVRRATVGGDPLPSARTRR